MTKSEHSVSATMSEFSGILLLPVSAESGQMMIWRLMFAASHLLRSVRPATGQVRISVQRTSQLISHSLLQDIASSLMMLSSSDEDERINLMNHLFRETVFFINRAILSELRAILSLMS